MKDLLRVVIGENVNEDFHVFAGGEEITHLLAVTRVSLDVTPGDLTRIQLECYGQADVTGIAELQPRDDLVLVPRRGLAYARATMARINEFEDDAQSVVI